MGEVTKLLHTKLFDDRPITSLCVVENPNKCPKGFNVISKTYDQDSDADLWKDSSFFGRKCTRYLCLSKTEGDINNVIKSLNVIPEKEFPPVGSNTIHKTVDSEEKAWRKRKLCFEFVKVSESQEYVTDIIILSKAKRAPEGFLLCGEINSMILCYKIGKKISENTPSLYPQVPYPLLPFNHASPKKLPDDHLKAPNDNEEVINNNPLLPRRPAPKPPVSSYGTISGYNGLEGVPFILNPKFNFSKSLSKDFVIPKPKTVLQVNEEYSYEFRVERQT